MELSNFCSWPGEDIPLNLYWPSVTPRMTNRRVIFVSVKFDRMSIYYFGRILDFFSQPLYLVVQVDGMMGAGVFLV